MGGVATAKKNHSFSSVKMLESNRTSALGGFDGLDEVIVESLSP